MVSQFMFFQVHKWKVENQQVEVGEKEARNFDMTVEENEEGEEVETDGGRCRGW